MREVETARPNPSWDIWWFWQKRQRSGHAREEDCARAGLARDGRLLPEVERSPCDARGGGGAADARLALGARGTAATRAQLADVVGGCVQLGEKTFHPCHAPIGLGNEIRKKGPSYVPGPHRFHGGDEGIRTLGLCLAKAALSQLSYIPRRACAGAIVAICRGHVNVKVRELRKSITGHRLAGDAAATVSYVLAAKNAPSGEKMAPERGFTTESRTGRLLGRQMRAGVIGQFVD